MHICSKLFFPKASKPKISKTPIEMCFLDFPSYNIIIIIIIIIIITLTGGLYIASFNLLTIQINNRPYIPFTKASLTLQATAAESGLTIDSPCVMVVRVHNAFSSASGET